MKIAIVTGRRSICEDERYISLVDALRKGGCSCSELIDGALPDKDTDMIMSVGGDGTFLSTSVIAAPGEIPVLGVNLGRMGFLSEYRPEDVATAVLSGDYTIENRTMLNAKVDTGDERIDSWPYALNEMSVRRSGAAMLGVDVEIDGVKLPTYWSDGLVVSTSSGSTAYSLSVGGPIVLPESKVLIVSPIAPHNLNVRPLVIPDSSVISLRMQSRDGRYEFSADNRTCEVNDEVHIVISVAQFSLKRVRLNKSNFIDALTEKLFWGEDVRNIK
jgi:NAD+ kinase